MTCGNCAHPWEHHGDRAIGACATAVRASTSPWRRVICPCPGYSHDEPTMSYLPPLFAEPNDGMVLPGDRPRTLWERLGINHG